MCVISVIKSKIKIYTLITSCPPPENSNQIFTKGTDTVTILGDSIQECVISLPLLVVSLCPSVKLYTFLINPAYSH